MVRFNILVFSGFKGSYVIVGVRISIFGFVSSVKCVFEFISLVVVFKIFFF